MTKTFRSLLLSEHDLHNKDAVNEIVRIAVEMARHVPFVEALVYILRSTVALCDEYKGNEAVLLFKDRLEDVACCVYVAVHKCRAQAAPVQPHTDKLTRHIATSFTYLETLSKEKALPSSVDETKRRLQEIDNALTETVNDMDRALGLSRLLVTHNTYYRAESAVQKNEESDAATKLASPTCSGGADKEPNKRLQELSVEDVTVLLDKLEMPIDLAVVRENKINGNVLSFVESAEDLAEYGFSLKRLHARSLLSHLQEFRKRGVPEKYLLNESEDAQKQGNKRGELVGEAKQDQTDVRVEREEKEREREEKEKEERERGERERRESTLISVRRWCAQANNSKSSPLYLASKAGDVEGVEALLRCTQDMVVGESEAVKRFVRGGANEQINKKDESGDASLHIASRNGHKDIVETLLRNNANTEEKTNNGATPLHIAAQNGHKDVVETLLRNKANIEEKINNGCTPLYIAAYNGQKDVVETLLRNNANIEEKTNNGYTPLHIAAQKGHKDVVETLLRNNANIKTKCKNGWTPLHSAAQNGHKDVVETLLRNNANIEEKYKDGKTPLHIAARKGQKDVVETLLINNANIEEKQKNGYTPLYFAACNGQKDVVETLLKYKAKIEEKDNYGCTPLYSAACNGHKDVVETLLRNNANIETKPNLGWTPLYSAAQNGHKDVVETLLRNKANIETKDNNGWTPLYIAAQKGHKDVVETLLRNKANTEEKTNDGYTPLYIAAFNGHKAVEQILRLK